eukprot:5096630-Pleurochrysis_carterae.AAC.1
MSRARSMRVLAAQRDRGEIRNCDRKSMHAAPPGRRERAGARAGLNCRVGLSRTRTRAHPQLLQIPHDKSRNESSSAFE